MNCRSCGAPMRLYRDRDYFFCEYCGAFHFPPATADGLRVLGEAPERIYCPVCRERLHIAALDGHFRGYHCAKCRGILLDRFAFRDVVQMRRAAATTPPITPEPLDRSQLQRRLGCPKCGQAMETHPYYGPSNIIIDTCNRCNLIWLDYAELDQAVNAPGRDRSAAEPIHGLSASQSHKPASRANTRRSSSIQEMGQRPRTSAVTDLLHLLDNLFF